MNLIGLNEEKFIQLNHIIAAPNETSKSILYYLSNKLKIKSEIKIYKLNSQGLVSNKKPAHNKTQKKLEASCSAEVFVVKLNFLSAQISRLKPANFF